MSKVEPALTPEEWRGLSETWFQEGWFRGDHYLTVPQRHGLAASCLHGQPFGFTREDVDTLRWGVHDLLPDPGDGSFDDLRARVRSLADRIEALLPPEDL